MNHIGYEGSSYCVGHVFFSWPYTLPYMVIQNKNTLEDRPLYMCIPKYKGGGLYVNNRKELKLHDFICFVQVCREALEVLTVCLVVCPQALEALNKDKAWQTFIIDLLLLCKSR